MIQEIREYSPLGSILEAAGAFLESYAKTRALKESQAAEQGLAREQMDLRRWETTQQVGMARERMKFDEDMAKDEARRRAEEARRNRVFQTMEFFQRGALNQQEAQARLKIIESEHKARMAEIAASNKGGGGGGRWEPQTKAEWLETYGRDKGGASDPNELFVGTIGTMIQDPDPNVSGPARSLLFEFATARALGQDTTPILQRLQQSFTAAPPEEQEPEKKSGGFDPRPYSVISGPVARTLGSPEGMGQFLAAPFAAVEKGVFGGLLGVPGTGPASALFDALEKKRRKNPAIPDTTGVR